MQPSCLLPVFICFLCLSPLVASSFAAEQIRYANSQLCDALITGGDANRITFCVETLGADLTAECADSFVKRFSYDGFAMHLKLRTPLMIAILQGRAEVVTLLAHLDTQMRCNYFAALGVARFLADRYKAEKYQAIAAFLDEHLRTIHHSKQRTYSIRCFNSPCISHSS